MLDQDPTQPAVPVAPVTMAQMAAAPTGVASKDPVRMGVPAAPVPTIPAGGPAPAVDSRLAQFARGANLASTPLVDTEAAKAKIAGREQERLAGGNAVNTLASMVGGIPAGVTPTPVAQTSNLQAGLAHVSPPGAVSPTAVAAAPVAAGASMTPATDAAKAEIEARTGSGNNPYTPVAANPMAIPDAANVSNPGQLQADQARYDQEQAAYKANPPPAQAAAATQMAQLASAATPPEAGPAAVATPAGHVFKAGGRLTEADAAMLTAASGKRAAKLAMEAKAPIIKGQQDMALAGVNNAAASSLAGQKSAADLANQTQLAKHAQGLKTSDPLYKEQLTSAKGTNASAKRVSDLQALMTDKKATPEDRAAAKETLRDLSGKDEDVKIARTADAMGNQIDYEVRPSGTRSVEAGATATAAKARTKMYSEAAKDPKQLEQVDNAHRNQLVEIAKKKGDVKAALALINAERVASSLKPITI